MPHFWASYFLASGMDGLRRALWPRPLRLHLHAAVAAAAILAAAFLLLKLSRPMPLNAAPDAVSWPQLELQPVASGFDGPVNLVSPDDGTNRLFVVERGGRIHIIENGERLQQPFLDIHDRVSDCSECGLLGLAFPPDFAEEGYFFVNYTSNTNLVAGDIGDPSPPGVGDTVIARFTISDTPSLADPDSHDPILTINQPASNHNGGHILFGPDNYLYIGMGDGGGGGDEFENAQNPQSLLGKILRIEVGATGDYTIPADNPFINTPDYRPEIWAEGVRNPWRFGFDPATGDFYVADVGQGAFEEVNRIAAADVESGGMNFGWPIMEGGICFPPSGSQACDRTELVIPVATYAHEGTFNCFSITGGHVFVSQWPDQAPVYLYGDFCSGRVWGLQAEGDEWVSTLLDTFPFQITTFGADAAGNIYLVDYDGVIYQLVDRISYQFIPSLSKQE